MPISLTPQSIILKNKTIVGRLFSFKEEGEEKYIIIQCNPFDMSKPVKNSYDDMNFGFLIEGITDKKEKAFIYLKTRPKVSGNVGSRKSEITHSYSLISEEQSQKYVSDINFTDRCYREMILLDKSLI